MSHFTTVSKVAVTDKKAFIKAGKELGYELVEGVTTMNGYQGNKMEAEVVLRHPKSKYDIGLVKEGKAYKMVSDWWGANQTVPDASNRMSQLTTKHTVVSKYAKMGFLASVKVDNKNNIIVNLTR